MKTEPLEITRGSGNVFRDLGYENADALQMKALLATQIIKTLDREALSVRKAQERTGIAAAEFSRIRNADLKRFTLDRLIAIVNKLGSRVDISFKIKPMAKYPTDARSTMLMAAEPKAASYKARKSRKAKP